MPTISVQRDDLEALIAGPGTKSTRISLEQLEQWLMLVKGELKGQNQATGELRIGRLRTRFSSRGKNRPGP